MKLSSPGKPFRPIYHLLKHRVTAANYAFKSTTPPFIFITLYSDIYQPPPGPLSLVRHQPLLNQFQHLQPSTTTQLDETPTKMDTLFLTTTPPLDPAWLTYESSPEFTANTRPANLTPLENQTHYATSCRALTARMTAPFTPFHHLRDIPRITLTVPSPLDNHPIPIIKYLPPPSRLPGPNHSPIPVTVLYIHGGGLWIGEADSEEFSCLQIVDFLSSRHREVEVYSVGYRLMPTYPAQTCLSDCLSAFEFVRDWKLNHKNGKLVVVGSSSGGELAALVSQLVSPGEVQGVVLRGPVTSDAFGGMEYVPERLRKMHTSAWEPSFYNSLLGFMKREVPRDGLERMPLEAEEEVLRKLPRTWIQVCTNDAVYSDGVCYAKALEDAGVEVKVDVIKGWPHTFWLIAPHLERSREADRAMLEGLAWVVQ
ncbi:Alpha/Beta hydrolase protein [Cercophora newfieldiana]|uniref:Alpha/Beta hydrolase protein n=1 Tax=Cercophora newfieldiana TaxID=92897 RepID=A0AA39YPR5_9PEZI|nr:Alpha/Beta hydrolase protein [Cercophora newfieldiana]